MQNENAVLSWLHVGDLHIARAGEQNHQDLRRIVGLAKMLPPGSLDFAVLPGDNADDGTPEQFGLVRDAVASLGLPLHILAGDHDFKQGNLDAFHNVLGADRLPKAVSVRGHRCLFLDVVSAGTGGPDFRVAEAQLAWAEREIDEAEAAGENVVIFMHVYPADLQEGANQLAALLARAHVACVDTGHTHYNELVNDGGTIFMATRSTGQVEEGPPGFSIAAVDGGGVSWRFKSINQAWPFVLVTCPVDYRLATDTGQIIDGAFVVHAKVVDDAPIESVQVRINDGNWAPMMPVPDSPALWQACCHGPAKNVSVRVQDVLGRRDEERVEPAQPGWTPPRRIADGSDRSRIGAWPEKALFDTQLGPNRNGRKW